MRKFVIVSVDNTKKYLSCLPIVLWAWEKLGWTPITVMYNVRRHNFIALNGHESLEPIIAKDNGWSTATLAQVSRLYVAGSEIFGEGDYIMTSDADMLPLSNYWGDPELNKITVWGHDLTGHGHYPICYIGMSRERWIEVMGIGSDNINQEVLKGMLWWKERFPGNNVWLADQDIVTRKINETEFDVKHIYRGVYPNGYAMNRVDRSAWSMQHNAFIDCHMHQLEHLDNCDNVKKFADTLRLLYRIWPEENFDWYVDHVRNLLR